MKNSKKVSDFKEKSKDLNLRIITGGSSDGSIDRDKVERPNGPGTRG